MYKLPQMIGYVKHFDSNKTMSFKVIENKLLKKYTKIWEIVSSLMNIEFDGEPKDKVNTNFPGNKIAKENTSYKSLSLIILDSVIRVNKKYYPHTLLEECKYIIKKNKMENVINADLDLSLCDNVSVNKSGNEFDNGSDLSLRIKNVF